MNTTERLSPWNTEYKNGEWTLRLDNNHKKIRVGHYLIKGKDPRRHTIAKVIADEKYPDHYFASVRVQENIFLTYELDAFLENGEVYRRKDLPEYI